MLRKANGNQAFNCSEEDLLDTVVQESIRKATKICIFSVPFYTLSVCSCGFYSFFKIKILVCQIPDI